MKTHTENIKITKGNAAEWKKKLADVEKIVGYVIADQGATIDLPNVTTCGYVIADTAFSDETEKALWEAGKKNSWTMTENTSEWLLSQQGDIIYKINDVQFDKGLFNKIRKGDLSAAEVFALPNMEQRRVAYEKLDKLKMKELEGFTVIHRVDDDGHQYPMQIVSFNLPGFSKPFFFLNCFCPSGGREYYLETQEKDCWRAKAASFGLPADVEWIAEY